MEFAVRGVTANQRFRPSPTDRVKLFQSTKLLTKPAVPTIPTTSAPRTNPRALTISDVWVWLTASKSRRYEAHLGIGACATKREASERDRGSQPDAHGRTDATNSVD